MLRPLSLLALASAALSARATLLDFEELTSVNGGGIAFYGTTVTTQGYVLSTSGNSNGLASIRPDLAGGPVFNYAGSIALFDGGNASFVTLTRSGGGLFDLNSIGLASYLQESNFSVGATVGFVGTRLDGTTVAQSFQLQPVDALQTFAFTGFTGLKSVTFGAQVFPYYQFDNVVLSPSAPSAVPGPAAALAFGVGLIRRRKRA